MTCLSPPSKEEYAVVAEYHVFSLDGERGETDLIELELTLDTHTVPKRQPPRQVPFTVRQATEGDAGWR